MLGDHFSVDMERRYAYYPPVLAEDGAIGLLSSPVSRSVFLTSIVRLLVGYLAPRHKPTPPHGGYGKDGVRTLTTCVLDRLAHSALILGVIFQP